MTPNTALVVAAGNSLGAAPARRFASEAMKVCVARRNSDCLAPLALHLRNAGGEVYTWGCGPIATAFAREQRPDLVAERPKCALLRPDDIADLSWAIPRYERGAWIFARDVWPWIEPVTGFQGRLNSRECRRQLQGWPSVQGRTPWQSDPRICRLALHRH